MNNDETGPTVAGRQTEERVPVQGSIESVGIHEVLQLAVAHAPARLVLRSPGGAETELWCTEDGYGTTEPGTGPEEVLAEALTLRAGTFAITEEPAPAVDSVPPPDALAAAEALAPLWAAVVAAIPDPHASVRLRRRAPASMDVTASQWRVLAHVGRGRGIGDLALLLRSSERASRRVVAELVSAGLLEVVHVAQPLTAPPTGPALAPPPAAVEDAATLPPPPAFAPPFGEPAVDDDSSAELLDASAALDACAAGDAPEALDRETVHSEPTWAQDDVNGAPAALPSEWDDELSALPAVADSWGTAPVPAPAPAAAPRAWDDESPTGDGGAGWGKAAAAQNGPIEWDPVPELGAGHAQPTPLAVPGFIEDPIAGNDEVLDSTDEELVNRALLFKFLSSVRE